MADVQITCVRKPDRHSPHERITHVGGSNWMWPTEDVVASIENRTNTFFRPRCSGAPGQRRCRGSRQWSPEVSANLRGWGLEQQSPCSAGVHDAVDGVVTDSLGEIMSAETAIGRPTATARHLVEASISANTRRSYASVLPAPRRLARRPPTRGRQSRRPHPRRVQGADRDDPQVVRRDPNGRHSPVISGPKKPGMSPRPLDSRLRSRWVGELETRVLEP